VIAHRYYFLIVRKFLAKAFADISRGIFYDEILSTRIIALMGNSDR